MKKNIKYPWFIICLTITIALAVLATIVSINYYNFYVNLGTDKEIFTKFGVVGDFFGGVLNPTYAFLGLLMLLVSLYQNQNELRLSREEFEGSKIALQNQSLTLDKQSFENTFFSLLEQHNNVLNKINKKNEYIDSFGNKNIDDSECELFKNKILKTKYSSGGKYFISIKDAKESLVSEEKMINVHFRVLYQILKFVCTNCPTSTMKNKVFSKQNLQNTSCSVEEKIYTNMIRSFLSEENYLLLSINCYCHNEFDTFVMYKLLIERYNFLEHMPINLDLVENKDIMIEIFNHYDDSVFGNNIDYVKWSKR